MGLFFDLPPTSRGSITIGILALQGAFLEHQNALERLSLPITINVVLVRTPGDLEPCDALIIPGGESTTIALLARISGLLNPLRTFIKTKPVWGTCAGAILLAQSVVGAKKGGQELLGGMSITMGRNAWGSQVESFEADLRLEVPGLRNPEVPFKGVFIRAPVVLDFGVGEPISVVARLLPDCRPSTAESADVVSLRQSLHLLTTFHPELTDDGRFHEYFVRECVLDSILSRP